MFLKNKIIIFKIRRSKVTDYAALRVDLGILLHGETEATILKLFYVFLLKQTATYNG